MRRQALVLGGAAMLLIALLLVALPPVLRRDAARPAQGEAAPTTADSIPLAPLTLVPAPERTALEPGLPAATEQLTVVVLDAASAHPVAGAVVTGVGVEELMRALESAGLVHDTPQARVLRQSLEMRAVTDAEGRALLNVQPARWMVEARSGGNWDFAMLNTLPPDRKVTLRLGPDRALRVLVIDPGGTPREGVPVALRQRTRLGPGFKVTTTAAAGEATFPHFQRRLQQGDGWQAGFAFPVRGETARAVDGATPLEPPVSLVLTGAGGLHVRVRDPRGATPHLDRGELRVTAFDPTAGAQALWFEGPWARRELDGRGEASFPWLGLGLELVVELRREGGDITLARTALAGPASEGQVVTCELLFTGPPALSGRFVRNDGSAWPACTVQAQAMPRPAPADYPQAQDVQVDAEGRFTFEAAYTAQAGGTCQYSFRGPHPDGSGDARAFVDLPALVPSDGADLGDVLLDHGPLLGAGRVVDDRGRALAGARLHLQAESLVQRSAIWRSVSTSGTDTTGEDGAFAFFLPPGEPDPGATLRIAVVRCDGYVLGTPRAIRRGDSGIVIALASAGALAGSVELDEGLAVTDVSLTLVGTTRQAFRPQRDGTFTLDGLAPGEYALEARWRGANGRPEEEPAAVVGGLWIAPGETNRDPRLQPLRLESALQTLRIAVIDRRGVPIPGASASLVGLLNARPVVAGPDGVCRVRSAELPVDLEVTAFGYRRQRLWGVATDTKVILDEGLAVRLVAGAAGSGRDPAYRLFALLFEVDDRGIQRGLVYADGFPVENRWFDANGQLALRLPGPGTYECHLSVSVIKDHVGCGATVPAPTPLRITVVESEAEQLFELGVPQSAVDAAVERALE